LVFLRDWSVDRQARGIELDIDRQQLRLTRAQADKAEMDVESHRQEQARREARERLAYHEGVRTINDTLRRDGLADVRIRDRSRMSASTAGLPAPHEELLLLGQDVVIAEELDLDDEPLDP
jgi:hypothetical protein